MRLEPDSPQPLPEERRYFPDWTGGVVEVREGVEAVADHYSYLAGGYAEEFGYHPQPGSSRGEPVLDGEPPDTHPGYPLKPRPVALEAEQDGAPRMTNRERQRFERYRESPPDTARETRPRGAFVRVTDRPYERERYRFQQRAAAVLTRLLAALMSFRWGLPRRHRTLARW